MHAGPGMEDRTYEQAERPFEDGIVVHGGIVEGAWTEYVSVIGNVMCDGREWVHHLDSSLILYGEENG